jgi:hypothetical protein
MMATKKVEQASATKQLEEALNVIRAQATEIAREQVRVAKLAEQAIALARGTGDVSQQAQAAVAAVAEEKLTERIREALLASGPMSVVDLSKTLNEPAARLQHVVKVLRAARKMRNVGDKLDPVWCWAVGDSGDTPELRKAIERLIRFKGMSLTDLVEATGCTNRNRISGALVKLELKLEGETPDGKSPMVNLGTSQRFIYFIPAAKRARRNTARTR